MPCISQWIGCCPDTPRAKPRSPPGTWLTERWSCATSPRPISKGTPVHWPGLGTAATAKRARCRLCLGWGATRRAAQWRSRCSPAIRLIRTKSTGRVYRSLAAVERAFRRLKTGDLHVRPSGPRWAERVRAHVFLCILAWYGGQHPNAVLRRSSI